MIVMRWFRKNTKKFLAVIVVVLMIAFVIPSVFLNSDRRGRGQDMTVGVFLDRQYQQRDFTLLMQNKAAAELGVLRALGLDQVQMTLLATRLGEMGGLSPTPALVVRQLLFPDSQLARQLQGALLQMLSVNRTDDDQRIEQARDAVDRLVSLDSQSKAALYYILLSEEARRAGIEATSEQIRALINARLSPNVAQQLGPMSVQRICEAQNLTEQQVQQAVGNYIAILRYGNTATRPLALSEAELRKTLRDQLQMDTVKGSFVRFNARTFTDDVAEPDDDALAAHFEAYKTYVPGKITHENPYGLGYMLGDRVRLEYLRVDMKAASAVVEADFSVNSMEEQEKQIRRFWQDNSFRFRVALEQPADESAAPAEPAYRDPEFDEVADDARQMWVQDQSRIKAEQLLNQARRLSGKASAVPGSAEAEQPEAAAISDYSAIAAQLSTDSLAVGHEQTDYLTRAAAAGHLEFARTYRIRQSQPVGALLDIVFQCETLHQGALSSFDEPPVKLNQDIGPLIAVDYAGNPSAVYLVRVLAADAARQAQSLADDGRQGPAQQPAAAQDESQLAKQVTTDWKNLQAFDLARTRAQAFALAATADWDQAFAQANLDLKEDPNNPFDPLSLTDVEQLHSSLRQMREYAATRPQAYLVEQIANQVDLLQKTVELARGWAQSDQQSLPVLDRPEEFSLLVFKQLQVELPANQDYLDRKPLAAMQLMMDSQQLMCMTHFDPLNIETRNGFERTIGTDSN